MSTKSIRDKAEQVNVASRSQKNKKKANSYLAKNKCCQEASGNNYLLDKTKLTVIVLTVTKQLHNNYLWCLLLSLTRPPSASGSPSPSQSKTRRDERRLYF